MRASLGPAGEDKGRHCRSWGRRRRGREGGYRVGVGRGVRWGVHGVERIGWGKEGGVMEEEVGRVRDTRGKRGWDKQREDCEWRRGGGGGSVDEVLGRRKWFMWVRRGWSKQERKI